jgi:hemolysin activation/secretion protein
LRTRFRAPGDWGHETANETGGVAGNRGAALGVVAADGNNTKNRPFAGAQNMKCIPGILSLVALCCAGPAFAQDAPAGDPAAPPAFDVWEYRVLGNTLLDARKIESAVYPHLGPQRTIEDVQAARAALESEFRTAGYGTVFVDIPEQDTADGVVRLQVTEGKLDRVRITGARWFANGRIRSRMPALAAGTAPRLPELQEQLARVNAENPDRIVTPVLRAGRTPGTVDLELRVEDNLPLHGSVEVNDRYSADTTRSRVAANLSYGDLFARNHSLSFQYQIAPEEPDESRVLAATYVAPLTPTDLLAFYAVDTQSDVAALGTLSVLGNGRIYGARYIRLLPAADGAFHNLTLGFDLKQFEESIRLDEDGDSIDTPIEYGAWSLVYAGGARSEHWRGNWSLGGFFGLRGLLNDSAEFNAEVDSPNSQLGKRVGARPNYFYLRATAGVERALPRGFTAALRVSSQFTTQPLINNEQFAIGGLDTVRGFVESEQLGDNGVSTSFELRSPNFGPRLGSWNQDLRLFLFYDAGVISLIDPQPDQIAEYDLASAGAGLRLRAFSGLEAAVDWAYPLVPSDRVAEGESRLHFSVKYGF